jgi:hypothetical protein
MALKLDDFVSATLTTTATGLQTILTYAVPISCVLICEADVMGKISGGNAWGYHLTYGFKRQASGNVLAVAGTPGRVVLEDVAAGYDADMILSGTNFIIRVNPGAATSTAWLCLAHVRLYQP